MQNDDVVEEFDVASPEVMNIKPVVSILMTTYNHEPYIVEAIEGVLKQMTDFPIELILGEDCSTDRTREIELDYQRRYPERIRIVYSSRNIGAYKNFTRMHDRVRGEFVAFCEGDDFWHDPMKLQKQVDFLRANPDYSMVASDYDWLVLTAGVWRRIKNYGSRRFGAIPQGDVSSYLPTRMFVKTCAMMVRADLLKLHFGSELYVPENSSGDRPIKLHMTKFGKVRCFEQSMATYRRTPGSHVNSGFASLLEKRQRKIDMDNRIAAEIGMDEQVHLEVQRKNFKALMFFAAATRNEKVFDEAMRWLKQNYSDFSAKMVVRLWAYLVSRPVVHRIFWRSRGVVRELMLRAGWIRQDFVQDE